VRIKFTFHLTTSNVSGWLKLLELNAMDFVVIEGSCGLTLLVFCGFYEFGLLSFYEGPALTLRMASVC